MAIAAIYILLMVAMAFTYLGFWKEDFWLIILAAFSFVGIGLYMIVIGFEDITSFTYKWMFGIIILFTGAYLGSRAMIEMLKEGL